MPAERVEGNLFLANRGYCHNAYGQAQDQLVGTLLRACYVLLFRWLFKRGASTYEELHHAQQEAAAATATSTSDRSRVYEAQQKVKNLTSELKDKHREFLHLFFEDQRRNDEMLARLEKFCQSACRIVATGGSEETPGVLKYWQEARGHADTLWSQYHSLDDQIKEQRRQLKEWFAKLGPIEREIHAASGTYSMQNILETIEIAWKIREIEKVALRLEQKKEAIERLGEIHVARAGVEQLMRGMQAHEAGFEKRFEARNNERNKQSIQELKAQSTGTHVKYQVKIEFEKERGVKLLGEVLLREGREPRFCGARTREAEPPHGSKESEMMRWTPPLLEAKLETTNDPLQITLKELKISSKVHGNFSKTNIPLALPRSRKDLAKTVKHTGTIGGHSRQYTIKITTTKVGKSTNCTAFPCNNSAQVHWIHSGYE